MFCSWLPVEFTLCLFAVLNSPVGDLGKVSTAIEDICWQYFIPKSTEGWLIRVRRSPDPETRGSPVFGNNREVVTTTKIV